LSNKGRRKKEEGRRKKEEGRRENLKVLIFNFDPIPYFPID